MSIFSKLLLLISTGFLTTSPVLANIYRVDFTYGADSDPGETGSLTGFMTFDLSQGSGTSQILQDLGPISIPDWITLISLTFDPDPSVTGDETTVTSDGSGLNKIEALTWNVKTSIANAGTFDITADFVPQMDGLVFASPNFGPYDGDNGTFSQQHIPSDTEFPLQSTATTPGGLPILGIGVLACYYKKLKSNKYKL